MVLAPVMVTCGDGTRASMILTRAEAKPMKVSASGQTTAPRAYLFLVQADRIAIDGFDAEPGVQTISAAGIAEKRRRMLPPRNRVSALRQGRHTLQPGALHHCLHHPTTGNP
jgi:hypothetical protein